MRPRPRRWASVLVVGGIATIAILFACVFVLPDVIRLRTWTKVDAVVVRVVPTGTGTDVAWRYETEDGVHTGEAHLSVSGEAELESAGFVEGGSVPIHYDPEAPGNSAADISLERSYAIFLVVVSVAVGAFLVTAVAAAVRGRRDRTRLLGDTRPLEQRPLTTTRSGLLGVKSRDGLTAVMERGGISIVGGERIRWDEVVDVAFDPSRSSLRLEIAADEFRHVRMHIPKEAAEDWAGAVVSLAWFAMTYPAARPALDRPSVVRHFMRELEAAIQASHDPDVDTALGEEARAALTETMRRVVTQAGVDVVAGRSIRGYDLDVSDPAVLASARAWLPPEVAALEPADTTLASSLVAAQGRRPPWPLDVFVEARAQA
ncbi:MAG: hypothetical protein IT198_12240 [Acidimicrobiia bacterium]|nr:hypothetical protein [Acidimicrobiia bacterium]